MEQNGTVARLQHLDNEVKQHRNDIKKLFELTAKNYADHRVLLAKLSTIQIMLGTGLTGTMLAYIVEKLT